MTPIVQTAAILEAHKRAREWYVFRYAYVKGPWHRRTDVWLLTFLAIVAGIGWMLGRHPEALVAVLVIVPLLLHSVEKAFTEGHATIIEQHRELYDKYHPRKRAIRFFVFVKELAQTKSLPDAQEISGVVPLVAAECEVASGERFSNLPVLAFLLAAVVAILGGAASISDAWDSHIMPMFLVVLTGLMLIIGFLFDGLRPAKFHTSELLLFLHWLALAIESGYELEVESEEKDVI